MRTLLELTVEKSGEGTSPENYMLVGVDAAKMPWRNLEAYVDEKIREGSELRTAREFADRGLNLSTYLLVRIKETKCQQIWIVDGWSLLRFHGENTDLTGAPLRGANLEGARLSGTDLSEADLRGANLEKGDLTFTNFTGADLSGATLYRAGLKGADFTEADLSRADLRHADLQEVTLVRAALRGADLWEAYMWKTSVEEAFTDGASMERASYPENLANFK